MQSRCWQVPIVVDTKTRILLVYHEACIHQTQMKTSRHISLTRLGL